MEWSEAKLRGILAELRTRRGDTTSIEVKRASGGVPKMPETLSAFGNMPNGGTVILGVDEAQGRFDVVGVKDIAETESGITAQARDAVQPSPHLDFQTLTIDGKQVVVLHVAPLRIADRPAYAGDRAYLRQADGDYAMQPHELRMLEVMKLHVDEQIDYDLAAAKGRDVDDLEPELVESYLTAVRTSDRRLRDHADERILRMTNVLTASGEPTLAGLYALGDYPQGHYPALMVTAAVQMPGGEHQVRNRNLQDCTGPLPVLLSDLLAWVEDNIGSVQRYREDGHMESVSELPLNAVRELIANALVHRDLGPNTLGMGKQIQIRLTPTALFIQSPGGLRGISLAQIESVEHAQAAVNQRLYQIAKRLRTNDGASVIEGEGGGIREVFTATKSHNLPRPQLVDTGVQFKALMWRHHDDYKTKTVTPPPPSSGPKGPRPTPHTSAPTRNEEQVLAALAAEGALTIHDLADHAGLSTGQVRYALALPLKEGIVVMDGRQGVRSTRYRIHTAC